MLQTDHVVHDGGHDLARRLGVAMRHGHGDFFVAAENHFRIRRTAALVIDQGIVNAAKARPGIERDVFDAENFQQIDDQIGTVACGHKTSSVASLPVKRTASCRLLKKIQRRGAHGP